MTRHAKPLSRTEGNDFALDPICMFARIAGTPANKTTGRKAATAEGASAGFVLSLQFGGPQVSDHLLCS
jgi:hypothetical protein